MRNIKNLLSGQSSNQDQFSGYVKYTPSGKPDPLRVDYVNRVGMGAGRVINKLAIEIQSIPSWPRTIDDVIKEIKTVTMTLTEIEEGIEIRVVELA